LATLLAPIALDSWRQGSSARFLLTAAAADAFRRFLWRIRIVSERLRSRDRAPDVEIVDVVTAMLADPCVAHMLSREDGS
jgi:hypothetical protein